MTDPATLARAVADRSRVLADALGALDDDALLAPSRLRDWSRLTIGCHLRYGARALAQMTDDALAGRRASYYPEGRAAQRPGTLAAGMGESPTDVVRSLRAHDDALAALWSELHGDQWSTPVLEPDDNPDLGPTTIGALPLMRLTEVEVHGADLDVGLDHWSDTFVQAALPFRLQWLNTRRSNHRRFDADVRGSWLLVADDGPTYLVATDGAAVRAEPALRSTPADATITGAAHDLLALLLGRADVESLQLDGDPAIARAFSRAFPGP